MLSILKRRLWVYVVAGLAVLVGGVGALIAWQGEASESNPLVVLTADGAEVGPGASVSAGRSNEGSAGTMVTTSAPTTSEAALIYVQVSGAVRYPGVYKVPAGTRVFDAVARAGGFTSDADTEAIALAVEVVDGCRVHVPRLGDAPSDTALIPQVSSTGVEKFNTEKEQSMVGSRKVVSLNTASKEELESLPGIGPALAQRIIGYREANGPFTSVEQLSEVPGIGPARLEQLRPLVGL